jgi:hypothetical protein
MLSITKNTYYLQLLKSLLWRGEPPEVDFYAFWRVRLALHVIAKGIYIPGFCISTFIIYRHTFNRLLLHLIIVYFVACLCVLLLLYNYTWFLHALVVSFIVTLLLGFLVSFL